MSPRTYIDPADNDWVTEEDSGETREATPEEIDETIQQWEQYEQDGDEASKQE
ncbi:hypothetical protein NIES2109_30590 [Nostoc sp. HK-01]|nr:hypothetical protein NIES2109_30590 [Nostoc sp. HK-01]